MLEWFDSLNIIIKLIVALATLFGVGGGSILMYILFRKLYFADVSVRESTAEKNRADAAKTLAEADRARVDSIVISDEKTRKQTILSIDEVATIVKNFGVQLAENAKTQESLNDAILLSDRRRTEIDELKGVVEYQRDEMREARAEMKQATFELGKCSGECNSRDEKINDLETRLRRAERTLREHDLLPDPIHQTGTGNLPNLPT